LRRTAANSAPVRSPYRRAAGSIKVLAAMRVRNKMQGMRAATVWVRLLFKRLYEKAFAVLAIPDQ
jgi:hypothetical protein